MQTVNRVFLLGNLARDPELRFMPTGVRMCEFTVAVSTRRMQDLEPNQATEFVPVCAWDRLAELCHERLEKGSLVHLEGHLKARRWLDRKTKAHHSRLVVTVSHINFLARLKSGPSARAGMGHTSAE